RTVANSGILKAIFCRAKSVGARLCLVTDQQAQLATTVDTVRPMIAQQVAALQAAGNPAPKIGLVPTMGALHDGHGALVEEARAENDGVVASVFVHPPHFDPQQYYER